MATFTVELRRAVELANGEIGLDTYPIFEDEYRELLNKKIVDHYAYREIGFETIDMFINRLRTRMNEIMPPMNKLYLSERLDFDPLSTMDMTSETDSDSTLLSEGTENSTAASNSKTGSKARNVSSVLPQQQLSGNGDYADAASDAISDTEVDSDATDNRVSQSTGTNQATSTAHTTGYSGSPSDLLLRYRDTIVNVDMMVINALEDLFMGIWNTADEYSQNTVSGYSGFYFGGMY